MARSFDEATSGNGEAVAPEPSTSRSIVWMALSVTAAAICPTAALWVHDWTITNLPKIVQMLGVGVAVTMTWAAVFSVGPMRLRSNRIAVITAATIIVLGQAFLVVITRVTEVRSDGRELSRWEPRTGFAVAGWIGVWFTAMLVANHAAFSSFQPLRGISHPERLKPRRFAILVHIAFGFSASLVLAGLIWVNFGMLKIPGATEPNFVMQVRLMLVIYGSVAAGRYAWSVTIGDSISRFAVALTALSVVSLSIYAASAFGVAKSSSTFAPSDANGISAAISIVCSIIWSYAAQNAAVSVTSAKRFSPAKSGDRNHRPDHRA